jgi:hypothetical protein
VLAERGPQREPARIGMHPAEELIEGDSEDRAVDGVNRESRCSPARPARHCLAQQRDIRVVAPEQPLVERLLQTPDGRRHRAGSRSSGTAGHDHESAVERRQDLAVLGEAGCLRLGEDHPAVRDDVVLALVARERFGVEALCIQLGRETRGPFVIAASGGAVVDLDAHVPDPMP